MKSPQNQRPDDEAREMTEEFIATHARKQPAERAHGLAAETKAGA